VTVARYVLELFVPRGETLEAASARARELRHGEIRYVRTTLVAEDETCFHVFESTSLNALLEAAARSDLSDARISEAVETETKEG
jgi:hypothetical protein